MKQEKDFIFLNKLDKKYLSQYFRGKKSLFRYYQEHFIKSKGQYCFGHIIEIGAVSKHSNKFFFPNATEYLTTNISGKGISKLDVTNMAQIEDSSIDTIVCISVLEHVYDIKNAIREMKRVLKPDGQLLITIPFIFPKHDKIDYYRFGSDYFLKAFKDFNQISITSFGGKLSTIVSLLQRPCGKINYRYFFYKLVGFFLAIVGSKFDEPDTSPIGYGIFCRK